MTLLPIAAPTTPTPSNGSPAVDVASVSGDFAALLALVAGAAPPPDGDPALTEGAVPEPATSEPEADPGESGRNQTAPPDGTAVPAIPTPVPVAVPAGPSRPAPGHAAEHPAMRIPAAPVAVGASPALADAPGPATTASPRAPAPPAGTPRAAALTSPVSGPIEVPVSSGAELPPASVEAPPRPSLVDAPSTDLAADPVAFQRPPAEVLPPGRGRPAVNVPAPPVAIDASPALAESSPAQVEAPQAAVATPRVGEESPVVPENLLPERRVVEKPLPRADVPASAPLPAAAVRAEAARPVNATAPTPAAPPAVPEQIVSAVVPLHGRGDGRHEVTLELRPDDLGPIRVEVAVEQQTVHLTLHAAEPATGRLLSLALAELRTALADAGLRAGHLAVGPDGDRATGRRSRPDTPEPDTARDDATATPQRVRTIRPSAAGRLDLLL